MWVFCCWKVRKMDHGISNNNKNKINDKTERTRVLGRKNKGGDRKWESNDSPEISDGGVGIRHTWPLFGGLLAKLFSLLQLCVIKNIILLWSPARAGEYCFFFLYSSIVVTAAWVGEYCFFFLYSSIVVTAAWVGEYCFFFLYSSIVVTAA